MWVRSWGQFSLGIYTFAYNLAQWPITNFVAQINSLALPYFAQIKDDLRRAPAPNI